MKTGILAGLLLFTLPVFSGEHALGAHEHGSVKLALAVEGMTMDVDFDGPSESLIGFEHAPKSDRDKAIMNGAKNLWEKKLLTLIIPNAGLGCKISESSFKQEIEGSHADIEAKAKLTCSKNLAGTDVKIALIKAFPHIKKLKVEVLSATTTSVEITKPEQIIKL